MKVQIQLECGCRPYFPSPIPLLGDVLLCQLHGTSRRVEATWRFKCANCPYGRDVGDSPMTAEVKATSHAIRMHHRVVVTKYLGTNIIDEFEIPVPGSQLAITSDVPPF